MQALSRNRRAAGYCSTVRAGPAAGGSAGARWRRPGVVRRRASGAWEAPGIEDEPTVLSMAAAGPAGKDGLARDLRSRECPLSTENGVRPMAHDTSAHPRTRLLTTFAGV